ncbi:hypothetical protein, partial [Escherichia coli]
ILNCDSAAVRRLANQGYLEPHPSGGEDTITTRSVARSAQQLISIAEINARLGSKERRAERWLGAHGMQPRT